MSAIKVFDEYPTNKLEDKWACNYNKLHSIRTVLVEMTTNRRILKGKNAGGRPEFQSIFQSTKMTAMGV
jgi:hypothetical protein